MHNNPNNLMAAVYEAKGRKLNKNKFNDHFYLQKGCYILNRWGYGPEYSYRLFVKGPYSPELADDINKIGKTIGVTNIPSEAIHDLLLMVIRLPFTFNMKKKMKQKILFKTDIRMLWALS